MTFFVAGFVVSNLPFTVGTARNDRLCTLIAKGFSKCVRIITLVSDEVLRTAKLSCQHFGRSNIADVAWRESQSERATDHISQDVELAGLAAP